MRHSIKPDVTQVAVAYLCHSCGACAACCPQDAIRYLESIGGYLVPEIDRQSCSGCGLCYQVCPGVSFGKTLTALTPQDPFVGKILSCEVGKATDEAIFTNGQSGGVVTALLTHLFATGQIEAALVATMPTATPPRGDVMVATSPDDLVSAQKSKYSPISMLQALRHLGKLKGRVAVVGPACRFHGLHNLLDLRPKLLQRPPLKLGLVCDRVMTSAAIDFLGRQAVKAPISHLVWRDKQRPAYPGNPVVRTGQGEEILLRASQRMAIKDFFTPVRCRLCFDKLNVFADVVCGDPHGIKDIDRVGGETVVLVRTEAGRELVNSAKDAGAVELRGTAKDTAVAGQGISKKRSEWAGFMKAWQEMGHNPPRYHFTPANEPGDTSRFRKFLEQGAALDCFASRDDLLAAADNWLVRHKIKKTVLWPLAKFKGLWRRLRKGDRR